MGITDAIINYRRFIKRRNYSPHTVKNYMCTLRQFVLWLDVPIEEVTSKKLLSYIDSLLDRRLKPKTVNSHLDSIRGFYNYLIDEEEVEIKNPVKKGYILRLPRPLPRFLHDKEVEKLFAVIDRPRDKAIFMLMLRCGLRVEEIANMTLPAVDLLRSQIFINYGKGLDALDAGRWQDARNFFTKAVELDPQFDMAREAHDSSPGPSAPSIGQIASMTPASLAATVSSAVDNAAKAQAAADEAAAEAEADANAGGGGGCS